MAIMKLSMIGRLRTFVISTGRQEFVPRAIPGQPEPGALWLQGLAPYFFEIEPTFYFRGGGVAGRFAGLYNLYITQRLIL